MEIMVSSLLLKIQSFYTKGDTIDFPVFVSIGESGDLITSKLAEMILRKHGVVIESITTTDHEDSLDGLFSSLSDKSVLICDSMVNRGILMSNIRDLVVKTDPKDVRTLSLVVRVGSKLIPNFYAIMAGKFDETFFDDQYYPVKCYESGCIREIKESDSGVCLNLDEDYLSPSLGDVIYCMRVDNFKDYQARCLVVESSSGKDVIGYVYFKIVNEHELFIESIATDKAYRKQGYAGQLLDHLDDYCMFNRIDHIRLLAVEDYVGLYEKFEYSLTDFHFEVHGRKYFEMIHEVGNTK